MSYYSYTLYVSIYGSQLRTGVVYVLYLDSDIEEPESVLHTIYMITNRLMYLWLSCSNT